MLSCKRSGLQRSQNSLPEKVCSVKIRAEIGTSWAWDLGCDIWVDSLESLITQVPTHTFGLHKSHTPNFTPASRCYRTPCLTKQCVVPLGSLPPSPDEDHQWLTPSNNKIHPTKYWLAEREKKLYLAVMGPGQHSICGTFPGGAGGRGTE